MSNSDLLFSKRENGKIFLQEIFRATLHKCEKQLLQIKKEKSPIIQKRILLNSIYFSKLLLGRFLSLYRCYRSSKSNISTDVSKVDIENIFLQTNASMNNIFRTLKKGLSQFDPKMSRVVKFVDFQKPNFCGSHFIALIQQDIPSNLFVKFHGRKINFYNKQNLYSFTISVFGSKKLFLTDLHIKWPKQIPKLPEKEIKILAAQCQKIIDTPGQFLIDLDKCIRSYYFHGELLRITQLIHKNENIFGYQIQASDKSINICYPMTFFPRNVFKLTTDGIKGVYLHSFCQFSELNSDSDETNSKFLLCSLNELSEPKIYDLILHTHDLVHFSKIKSIMKRFQDFFSSSSYAALKILDDSQIIECRLFNVLAFRIGLDFITGDPIVYYCLVSDIGKLLIKAITCSQYNCYQYLRAFCACFFLKRLLTFPFGPHLKILADPDSLAIPSGKYVAFNFGKSCRIAYDDIGSTPILRSFSEGKYIQTESILYFNSIARKKYDIKSLNFFFPASFHELLDITIMRDLMNTLQESRIEAKLIGKELLFSLEPFGLIKFKVKSNYWQVYFIYPDLPNAPDNFNIKIVGRFISSRFVQWLFFLIFRITTFMQALKQVKCASGISAVVKKVIIYNSLYFKIEFNSSLPICIRIAGIKLNYIDTKKKCEVYTIPDPWSNLQITCSVYKSSLLKGYINSLLKTPEASYRFGPFLTGFLNPLQKIYQVFLSDPNSQWIVTSVQDGFSFFLVYRRVCTLTTIIRSSQTFQFILPHFGLSVMLQFAIPTSKFERFKQKFNSAIQVNISQLSEVKESIEEFFYERSLIENLEFGPPEYLSKQQTPAIRFNGPLYCQSVQCTLDENGIHFIISDGAPKYLKNIINVPIEGRKNRCRFIKFIFNTLKLGLKGGDFLKTLNDITEMPGHLLNWQQSVKNDDSLNVNFNDKSISMNLTTKFGHFYLVVYPDNDSVTISSDQGFQIEKVSTMNNMKSWFKKFVSDETSLNADDNDNDHPYF